MEEDTIICSCHNSEHQIRFIYNPEDNYVYSEVHLRKISFWRRIIYATKYVFGYKCKYGCFDEFIFTREHISALQKTIDTLKTINE